MFRGIEDFQEENNADEPVLDSTKMSTGSANTSYLDHDLVRTGAMMPEDWLVVP